MYAGDADTTLLKLKESKAEILFEQDALWRSAVKSGTNQAWRYNNAPAERKQWNDWFYEVRVVSTKDALLIYALSGELVDVCEYARGSRGFMLHLYADKAPVELSGSPCLEITAWEQGCDGEKSDLTTIQRAACPEWFTPEGSLRALCLSCGPRHEDNQVLQNLLAERLEHSNSKHYF
eukprot:TRINITY_DN19105_c0_g1_i2.p2 TRINITY_DN19105_c0_g1~~TRINITY_DN19105_c0_g1_i2.p2  ORF type:complete len:178 (+),score=36.58 TRINITY_DN19105_c0_g1_i2:161-694(+)